MHTNRAFFFSRVLLLVAAFAEAADAHHAASAKFDTTRGDFSVGCN